MGKITMKNLLICFLLILHSTSAQSIKDVIGKLTANAPAVPSEGLKKRMPYTIIDAKLAYFGALAMIRFEDQRKLGVFNLSQCQFQTFITLKSNSFIYACAGDLLLVYYPDFKMFESWDLSTFEKINSQKLALDKGFITHMETGAVAKTRAFISGSVGGGSLDRRFYGILDLKTLKADIYEKGYFRNSSYRDRINLRPNNAMTKVLIWNRDFELIDLNEKEPKSQNRSSSYGAFNFTNDENFIVSSGGDIVTPQGQKLKTYKGSTLFPVLGADFYIEYTGNIHGYSSGSSVNNTLIRVKELRSHSTLNEIKSPVTFKRESSYMPVSLPIDRYILASKIPDRLMVIDNANRYIYIFTLGLNGKGSSSLPPHAEVGKAWQFQLQLPSGSKVVVEDAPAGVKYEDGLLFWASPDSSGVKSILLSITKPGEDEYYKEYKILVK